MFVVCCLLFVVCHFDKLSAGVCCSLFVVCHFDRLSAGVCCSLFGVWGCRVRLIKDLVARNGQAYFVRFH